MAIPWIESFDGYNGLTSTNGLASRWVIDHGSPSIIAGRFGGQAVRLPTNGNIRRTLAGVGTTHAVGAAIKVNSLVNRTDAPSIALAKGGWNTFLQCGICIAANGKIKVGRATGGFYTSVLVELGVSDNQVIFEDVWHFIEVEFVLSDTVGRITVWVDNVQVVNATNLDNQYLGSSGADILGFENFAGPSGSDIDVDDIYYKDVATRIGERRVERLLVTADTVDKDWTRSTGSDNFALLDETLVDNTDYVIGTNVGDYDLYDLANLSSNPTTIDCVQLCPFGHKTDGASRSIYAVADSGATKSNGSAIALPSSAGALPVRVLETNPDGSIAWTKTTVNALQVGLEVAT
jgi:hypothetical protein